MVAPSTESVVEKMELKTTTKRNYGIDLLRIVSMFMIVILHTLGHGKALAGAELMSANYKIIWLLESAAYCAVNCFALVSGYVGLRSRFRLSGIVLLWLQVVFYHAIFTIFWALMENRPIDFVAAFTPVRSGAYWYYTAYFGISFFVPLVNAALEQLDRRTALMAAVGMVVLFSVYPTLTGEDFFKLDGGYHVVWLLVIYILGACLKKYEPLKNWGKGVWALVYAGAVLLSWGGLLLKNMGLTTINLIRYTSPTILLAAVALVMLFAKLEPAGRAQKCIALVSPLTFGVYLIHDSLFVRTTFISGRLASAAAGSSMLMLAKVLCFAAAVFVICLVIEYARTALFKALRVKELVNQALPK